MVYEFGVKKNLKIVDLTGAGDLFAAGFLHGYINNFSLKNVWKKELKCLLRSFKKLVLDFLKLFSVETTFTLFGLITLLRYFFVIKSFANKFLFFIKNSPF